MGRPVGLKYTIHMKFDAKKTLHGKIKQVLVTPVKDHFVTTPVQEVNTTFEGFPKDRHAGNTRKSGGREKAQYKLGTIIRNNRQWSALSEEELKMIAEKMGINEVKAQWVGANIIFEGIPNFSKLPPLSHILINPSSPDFVCLVVFEENGPCQHPNKIIAQETKDQKWKSTFMVAAKGLRGTVGWIDKPGRIRVGDEVKVLIPAL